MTVANKSLSEKLPTQTPRYTDSVALAKRRKTLPKYMIAGQIQALLRSIKSPRDLAIFRVAYHHGLRASEIGMIQMTDYRPGKHTDEDRLYIDRLKGSIGGEVLLVPAAALAIRLWIKKRGWADGPMFLSRKKTPISRYQLHRLMQHYAAKAGVPADKAHFHALKHTCATMMISELKESIIDVQKHLGHADIRSTMIYGDLTEQANEERAKRLRKWR